MEVLLDFLGPWGVMVMGLVPGLGVGLIPLLMQAKSFLETRKAASQAGKTQDSLEEEMRLKMRNIATEAFLNNQQSFLTMAGQTLQQQGQAQAREQAKELERRQEGIKDLLKPLKETVDQYRQQTNASQGALQQQLESLSALGQNMTREAAALRNALTSGPRVPGAWGEQQLQNVMALSGMTQHVDFDLQPHLKGKDGKGMQPDALVHLPGQGSIIVDAKAPLEAFIRAQEAEEGQAGPLLSEFTTSLRRHIRELSRKGYWSELNRTPEFVVLFLPSDSILATAFQLEPDLLKTATEHKVVLASPGTLVAMLTTVAYAWRQQSLHDNALEIAELGKKMYDALSLFGEHFEKLHKGIDQTAKAYSGMLGSIDRTLMPKARRFRDLQLDPGLKTLKEPRPLEDLDLRDPTTLRNIALGSQSQVVDQAHTLKVSGSDQTP